MSGLPTKSGYAAVYDLSVEDDHEFFAGGLLVHNCYEDTGRFFEARPHYPSAAEVDPLAHLVHDPLSLAHQRGRLKRDGEAAKRIGKRLRIGNLGVR